MTAVAGTNHLGHSSECLCEELGDRSRGDDDELHLSGCCLCFCFDVGCAYVWASAFVFVSGFAVLCSPPRALAVTTYTCGCVCTFTQIELQMIIYLCACACISEQALTYIFWIWGAHNLGLLPFVFML